MVVIMFLSINCFGRYKSFCLAISPVYVPFPVWLSLFISFCEVRRNIIKRKVAQYNKADCTALRDAARNLYTSTTETASTADKPDTENCGKTLKTVFN